MNKDIENLVEFKKTRYKALGDLYDAKKEMLKQTDISETACGKIAMRLLTSGEPALVPEITQDSKRIYKVYSSGNYYFHNCPEIVINSSKAMDLDSSSQFMNCVYKYVLGSVLDKLTDLPQTVDVEVCSGSSNSSSNANNIKVTGYLKYVPLSETPYLMYMLYKSWVPGVLPVVENKRSVPTYQFAIDDEVDVLNEVEGSGDKINQMKVL